jgi:hypothetical protein
MVGGSDVLCRVVISRQSMVVRLNGLSPDIPEGEFLPPVRPYGILRMAWAIWRVVPDVSPGGALSLVLRISREGRAEVLVATPFLAEHVRGMLLARHHLMTRLECEGREYGCTSFDALLASEDGT